MLNVEHRMWNKERLSKPKTLASLRTGRKPVLVGPSGNNEAMCSSKSSCSSRQSNLMRLRLDGSVCPDSSEMVSLCSADADGDQ